jgi:NADPH:quinone reductase
MMKAAWYERVGAADDVIQFGEQPRPIARQGEVLVAIHSSGVNPSDVKVRAGTRGGGSSLAYPLVIPHSDGAGVVAEVGEGVRRFREGDRVWVANAQWQRAHGTAAQFIAIEESLVTPLPDNVAFEVGAALGIPAVTACHATLGFGSLAGKTVVISGGAGTVGRLAVQFARAGGATVIATGAGAQDRERALSAGAHHFAEYTSPNLASEILRATGGRRIDHVVEVEFGANVEAIAELIAPRGRIVTYGSAKALRPQIPFYTFLFKGIELQFLLVYLLTSQERAAAARKVNELLGAGELDVPVHSVFPLRECALAHRAVESGARQGAVIVSCED